jgi:predicted DNA-binding transcriptional regulator AlpA
MSTNEPEDLTVLVRNVIAARRQLETAWRTLQDRVQVDEAGALATPTDPILRLQEVADLLKCGAQKLRKGYKKGQYPFFFREGVRLLARRQDVERWIGTRVKRSN